MSDPANPPPHQSKGSAVLLVVVVGVSALGVGAWHLLQNRGERERLDVSGFDLASAPAASAPALPAPAPAALPPDAPASSLGMLKADAGIRVVDANASGGAAAGQASAAANAAQKRQESGLTFQQAARKHQKRVQAFFLAATRKYPSVRQYGRDWMSYPDLKKLNDDFTKDRDPAKFLQGLAKSENFPKLVKKYATDPAIRAVVIDAAKQAPADLMSASMDYLQNDKLIKDLVGGVAKGLGLPSSLMAVFDEGKGGKVDQQQVMSDILKSNPEARRAMEQQGSGVSLGR